MNEGNRPLRIVVAEPDAHVAAVIAMEHRVMTYEQCRVVFDAIEAFVPGSSNEDLKATYEDRQVETNGVQVMPAWQAIRTKPCYKLNHSDGVTSGLSKKEAGIFKPYLELERYFEVAAAAESAGAFTSILEIREDVKRDWVIHHGAFYMLANLSGHRAMVVTIPSVPAFHIHDDPPTSNRRGYRAMVPILPVPAADLSGVRHAYVGYNVDNSQNVVTNNNDITNNNYETTNPKPWPNRLPKRLTKW